MGTDNVGQPAFRSEGWYAARAAEAEANLTGARRNNFERLVDAAGVNVDTLSPKARMYLVWLAGWAQPTIEGAVEVLEAARGAGRTTLDDVRDHAIDDLEARLRTGAPSVADVARLVEAIDEAIDDDQTSPPSSWAPESGAA